MFFGGRLHKRRTQKDTRVNKLYVQAHWHLILFLNESRTYALTKAAGSIMYKSSLFDYIFVSINLPYDMTFLNLNLLEGIFQCNGSLKIFCHDFLLSFFIPHLSEVSVHVL